MEVGFEGRGYKFFYWQKVDKRAGGLPDGK